MPKLSQELLELREENRRVREEVFKHIEKSNSEMGAVQAGIEWLTWAVRLIIGGLIGSLIMSLVNLALLLKK